MPIHSKAAARFDIKASDKTKGAFNSVNKSLVRMGKNTARLGALMAGLAFARGIVVAARFEKSISDLSAITGATGDQLAFLSAEARKMGAATTLSATQAADAFKLVASGKPELLESSEALAAVTREVVTLAEAAGIDMPQAAEALTAALNQFSAGAEEANRFINVLAAGSKFGASTIEETSEALEKAGTVASIAGISFEELNANIQGLAAVAIKGADAGTALRNAILKLQKQSNADFNPAIVGLTKAFQNLSDANLGTVKLMDLVGLRTIAATQALLKQADGLEILEDKITGTNVAAEQAAIRTDNLESDVKFLNSAFEELSISLFTRLNPAMRATVQGLTDLTTAAAVGLPDLEAFLVKGITAWNVQFLSLGASIAETLAALETLSAKFTFGDVAKRHLENARAWTGSAVDLWQRASDEMGLQVQVLEDQAERAAARLTPPAQDFGALTVTGADTDAGGGIDRQAAVDEKAATALEKLKVATSAKLEVIRAGLLSESEAETQSFLSKLLILEENRELELVSLTTFQTIKEQLEAKHEGNLLKIAEKAAKAKQAATFKGYSQDLKGLAGFMKGQIGIAGTQNKALFEIQKVAAIAEGVLKLNSTVLDAYAFGTKIGGPVVGSVMAGISAAAQIANLAAIASTSFGGGGISGGGAAGGGGAVPTFNADPTFGLPDNGAQGTVTAGTEITIVPRDPFTDSVMRDFAEQLQDQLDDGVVISSIKVA